jgi:hypothetical protein
LIIIPIFVDQINGYFVNELGITFPLSHVIKSVYLIGFLALIINDRLIYSRVLFLLSYMFILIVPLLTVNFTAGPIYSDMLVDLAFYAKLLMLPIVYFGSTIILKKREDTDLLSSNLIVCLFMILSGAIFASLFGFGRSNYGISSDGITYGFRGYFIAGNEISALYILLYSLFLFYGYYVQKSFVLLLFIYVLGGATAILMVTKTVLIGYVLISVMIPILLTFYYRGNWVIHPSKYMKKLYLMVGLLIFLSSTLGSIFFWDRIVANIDRMAHNLAKAENVLSFILSGRDARFGPVLELYYYRYDFLKLLFGTGWNHFQYINQNDGTALTAEMDLIDLLLSHGILGVMFIYSFWVYLLFKLTRLLYLRRSVFSVPLFAATALLFTNSFFSGHILYSAMLTFYLGFFIAVLSTNVKYNSAKVFCSQCVQEN